MSIETKLKCQIKIIDKLRLMVKNVIDNLLIMDKLSSKRKYK
jgi:hypothetical protein